MLGSVKPFLPYSVRSYYYKEGRKQYMYVVMYNTIATSYMLPAETVTKHIIHCHLVWLDVQYIGLESGYY